MGYAMRVHESIEEKGKKVTRKDRILSAARELFIEKGFTGTSVGEIVARAEITHSLLFHHFKNKENLWQLIKNQVIAEGRKIQEHTPNLDKNFKDFLTTLIKDATKFYEKNPDVVRILNWQRLELQGKAGIGLQQSEQNEAWFKACEHYKKTKEINPNIPTDFAVSLTLSLVTSVALDQNLTLSSPGRKDGYIDFVVASILKALS
jgi:AcrR family transcriptional regulator